VTEGSTLRLRVMRPEGGTNYHMVRSGPLETLTATTDQTRWSFAAHVPILTGEGIGFAKASPPGGFLTVTLPQDEPAPSPWILAYMSPPPDDGFSGAATLQDNPGPGSDLFVVLSADIEPDADGDLFGDDTQDLCPGRAGADRGCPPGALDPPAPVVVVNTITPASALAEIDPASVGINAGRRLVSLRVSCPAQRSVSCRGVVAAKTAKSVRIRAQARRAQSRQGEVHDPPGPLFNAEAQGAEAHAHGDREAEAHPAHRDAVGLEDALAPVGAMATRMEKTCVTAPGVNCWSALAGPSGTASVSRPRRSARIAR
jgi:hypothetical protein